jgi:hypothetical protein
VAQRQAGKDGDAEGNQSSEERREEDKHLSEPSPRNNEQHNFARQANLRTKPIEPNLQQRSHREVSDGVVESGFTLSGKKVGKS